jgi:methanogenic corrinoid protein MtbC1
VLFVWRVAHHAATSEGLHANRIACLFTRETRRQSSDARKENTMDETSNRKRTEKAFRDWQDGTAYITDLLADGLRWTIVVGRSQVSKTYQSKEEFVSEVLYTAACGKAGYWVLSGTT